MIPLNRPAATGGKGFIGPPFSQIPISFARDLRLSCPFPHMVSEMCSLYTGSLEVSISLERSGEFCLMVVHERCIRNDQ